MLISGIIIGTAFTLFIVPSIYMLVAKTHAPISIADESDTGLREPAAAAA
jgi:hypothetical protein